jgi:hypothetical protein
MDPPFLDWGDNDMSEPWYTKSIAEKHVEVAGAAFKNSPTKFSNIYLHMAQESGPLLGVPTLEIYNDRT